MHVNDLKLIFPAPVLNLGSRLQFTSCFTHLALSTNIIGRTGTTTSQSTGTTSSQIVQPFFSKRKQGNDLEEEGVTEKGLVDMKNMPYDALSVMHYGPKVIAKAN